MLNQLFPAETELWVEVSSLRENHLELLARRLTNFAVCPECKVRSERRHSSYLRRPSDLPCLGKKVSLCVTVARFFCDNGQCPKKTFAEPFPGWLERWARRTNRLKAHQLVVGFELGGEAGTRTLQGLSMPVSADTVINDIRQSPEPPEEKQIRVLGIDDWAKRKGVAYGSIVVDLESGRVVDVLDGRDVKTVTTWLSKHPEIEVVSRDRSKEYKKAVFTALPNATQVADRWHLLNNLREAVEKFICHKPACLRAAAEGAASVSEETEPPNIDHRESNNSLTDEADESAENDALNPVVAVVDPSLAETEEPKLTKAEQLSAARRARRQERFDQVKQLHRLGYSINAIARELNLAFRTVRKYIQAEECPQYPTGVTRGSSKLSPFLPYLESRWQAGTTNATQLWRELRDDLGFNGSRGLVSLWAVAQRKLLPQPLQYARQQSEDIKPPIVRLAKPTPWSARAVSWLLFHEKERLDVEELAALNAILEADEEVTKAYEYIQQFRNMVKKRLAGSLDSWIDSLQTLSYPGLSSLANGLRQDFDEVRNALSMSWSNASCEGHVNRLKFLKRQMYGRANFDLLRKRVLYRPVDG